MSCNADTRRSWRALAALSLLLGLGACGPERLDTVYPDLLVEQDRLDFGRLPVLNVGELPLTLKNRGPGNMEVTDVRITGDDAAFFATGALPDTISFGNQADLVVSFRPEAERSYTAELTVETNDPEEGSATVTLFGVGDTVAAIEVVPAAIDFGLVGEGLTAVEGFEIRSVGDAPLLVESVAFTGESSAAFVSVGSWGAGTIDPGASIPLSVGFSPAPERPGTTGTIRITSTDPTNRTVDVSLTAEVNRAPTPVCEGEEIRRAPGDVVTLDGSASYDPDGHEPLTYAWRVVERPVNSNTDLSNTTGPTTSIELDVPGTWQVDLCVTDALGVPSLECCRTRIRSVPAEKLYVELVWDHPLTDLDLHFLAPGALFGGPQDCTWDNPSPDFGTPGDASDDPSLSRDDLAGFGPEIVSYPDPASGVFSVVVDFAKDNGAADPTTEATLRVYEYGVVVAELTRTLGSARTRWEVATVAWPSGEVVAVDALSTY